MLRALGGLGLEGLEVLVIDDSSPDGTGDIADRLAAELDLGARAAPRAEGRPRAGVSRRVSPRARARRGSRLRDGLRLLARPAAVPRLAEAAERADLVLGSRYVEGFRLSAVHAAEAGYQVVELHAAHGYLLAQFLSPMTNRRPGDGGPAGRVAPRGAHRRSDPRVGARRRARHPAVDRRRGGGGLHARRACASCCRTSTRSSTTSTSPLASARPTCATWGRRRRRCSSDVGDAAPARRAAAADLAGVPHRRGDRGGARRRRRSRRHGAAADRRSRHAAQAARPGRAEEVRPCVSCNEECRAFDPALHVHGQPRPRADGRRAASGGAARRRAGPGRAGGPVAIVGAGPAGLECATALAGRPPRGPVRPRPALGGAARGRRVGAEPPGVGRAARLLRAARWSAPTDVEVRARDRGRRSRPRRLRRGRPRRSAATRSCRRCPGIERAVARRRRSPRAPTRSAPARLVVVDDGFGWWLCASAVELGVRAGFARSWSRRRAPPSARRCRPRAACSSSAACAARR